MSEVRVAAVQFAVGTDVAANLAACLRMVAAAAARGAEVIVLPAYCNHSAWFADREHARRVACRPGDGFLEALGAAAARHRIYLKAHVTLADDERVSAASILFSPGGDLIARGESPLLPGPDSRWLDPAREPLPVADTPVGRLGIYGGGDGVFAEPPRALALRGAQVMLVSLSSVTTDDARLHVPVRAAENKTWVVAANTVAPPPGSEVDGWAGDRLSGAGQSSIVGPDGGVVAQAPLTGEAVIVATIEPQWADDKTRPDGSDVFLARRPDLYASMTSRSTHGRAERRAAARVAVAVVRPQLTGMSAIEDAARLVRSAAADGADLVVLPELFFYPQGRSDGSFLAAIAVDMLSQALAGTGCHAVTTLPDDSVHLGVLIDAGGVIGGQAQLHASARHVGWQAALGDSLVAFDLEWGRLVIAVGDDCVYPETFRLAALLDADAVAVPCTPTEWWELSLGLPERVAEHRLNIVAAAHAGPGGGGVIITPAAYPTPRRVRAGGLPGPLAEPEVTAVPADARRLAGEIFPARRRVSTPSADTVTVVDTRPPRRAGVLGLAAQG